MCVCVWLRGRGAGREGASGLWVHAAFCDSGVFRFCIQLPVVTNYCCCCCLSYTHTAHTTQFDALQTCSGPSATPRRPPCNTLLDVFENIRWVVLSWRQKRGADRGHTPRCMHIAEYSWRLLLRNAGDSSGSHPWGSFRVMWPTSMCLCDYYQHVVLRCAVLWLVLHHVSTKPRDDEIEHVKTMNACQDPARIASDLAARRNGSNGNGNGGSSSS